MTNDVTYGQAKKKLHLSMLNGNAPDVMKYLVMLQEKADGDEEKEDEVREITECIMTEDEERLEEIIS